jgi:hypothetical protein
MKRIAIALAVVFLLVFFGLFVALRDSRSPDAPRYVTELSQPVGPFATEQYDWGGRVPIRDGRLWLHAVTVRTNAAKSRVFTYLYDLNRQRVIGQLSNANPDFASLDQTKLLCEGFGFPRANLKQRLGAFVNRISAGKISLFSTNWSQTFWVLDLRDNSAVRIGELSQLTGAGSTWTPAPGFRFGYNVPSTANSGREFFLGDLEKKTLQKIAFTGDLQGWWDNHEIVAIYSYTNFVLFDVMSRQTSPLFTTAAVSEFLARQGITNSPINYAAIFNWNGSQYDFYLTAERRHGMITNTTFLLRVEHDGPRFTLLSRNFQLHWAGYFDATGTHYVYSGESGAPGSGGNGGVYLRDLSNNLDRVLVPPDNHGQYALARIYSNTVIYWRDRVLWRVDINTTNSSRLFPPPAN